MVTVFIFSPHLPSPIHSLPFISLCIVFTSSLCHFRASSCQFFPLLWLFNMRVNAVVATVWLAATLPSTVFASAIGSLHGSSSVGPRASNQSAPLLQAASKDDIQKAREMVAKALAESAKLNEDRMAHPARNKYVPSRTSPASYVCPRLRLHIDITWPPAPSLASVMKLCLRC